MSAAPLAISFGSAGGVAFRWRFRFVRLAGYFSAGVLLNCQICGLAVCWTVKFVFLPGCYVYVCDLCCLITAGFPKVVAFVLLVDCSLIGVAVVLARSAFHGVGAPALLVRFVFHGTVSSVLAFP